MYRTHFFLLWYILLNTIGVSAAGSSVGTQKTMVEKKNIKTNNQERACSRR